MSSLSSILSDYVNRFDFPSKVESGFYTSLDQKDYYMYLPYIYSVESFCIRVKKAICNKEKVLIYSDYDTDAVTATATMYHGLSSLGMNSKNLDYYAPDRFTEGYGMNPEAVDRLSKTYNLMISVDCGINSVQEAEIAQKNGCDLIITDHHHLSGKVPKALAVINPRLTEYYKINKDLAPNINFLKEDQPEYYKIITATIKNANFLPSSVTGVGVAWFCLVWLAYYLEN